MNTVQGWQLSGACTEKKKCVTEFASTRSQGPLRLVQAH